MIAPAFGNDLLSSIGICVGAAALLALIGWRLRQPLILAYLVTGVVIGPNVLNFVKDQASIQTVAEIGLILLLFIIGLEIDLKKLASAGAPVLLTGALQVPICIALGWGFFYLVGVRNAPGDYSLLYLAACMSLSSTLVVVKLLYDKFELDTLPGRVTLGVLVIQDLWAVGMLAVQPNLSNPNFFPLAFSLLKGALLVVGALNISKYILPYLFRAVAKAPELVLVSALAWCFFLAGVAQAIGLSREMGALIAGVSLSTFPYNLDVMAKAVSIRDFFVTLFFVALGMQIPVPSLEDHNALVHFAGLLGLSLAASAFVILSRLSVVPILYALRLGHRASLIPAINLAQVSEFSIVIASLGLTQAHAQITTDVVTVVIITFALTAVVSTYMINSSHAVQKVLSRALKLLRVKDLDSATDAEPKPEGRQETVVFLGFFRDASSILYEFEHAGDAAADTELLRKILVIDFNPSVMRELRNRKISCIYGDIAHADTLRHAGIQDAELVVSSITDDILRGTNNLRMLKNARTACPKARVMLTTEHIPQALAFYAAGADLVYLPRLHSAPQIAGMLRQGLAEGFDKIRAAELERLAQRREVLRSRVTRILAIADEVDEGLYTDKLVRYRADLVVSCGDLPFDYLEYVVSRLDVPLVYVPGNHDPEVRSADPTWAPLRTESLQPGPQGCENADGRVVVAAGLRIAGLGGSMRYKPGPNQYTDAGMRWRALSLEMRVRLNPARRARKLDVLLTHAPPFGWSAPDDPAHRGFAAFVRLVKNLTPRLLIHGHVHPYGRAQVERRLAGTQIINAVPARLIEL